MITLSSRCSICVVYCYEGRFNSLFWNCGNAGCKHIAVQRNVYQHYTITTRHILKKYEICRHEIFIMVIKDCCCMKCEYQRNLFRWVISEIRQCLGSCLRNNVGTVCGFSSCEVYQYSAQALLLLLYIPILTKGRLTLINWDTINQSGTSLLLHFLNRSFRFDNRTPAVATNSHCV